jgi:flagellar basal body-associated protein FliL
MLWILLLVLVLLVVVALVGAFNYRGRAAGAASPQTTIIERGHSADVSRRTDSTTVTRETEVIDE